MKKILIVFVVWLLMGCAPAPAPGIAPAPVIKATVVPTQIPDNPPVEESVLQTLITQAQTDLASRLDIKINEITLLDAQPVNWPDSSLGCPQPEMMYAQVITAGYQIMLAVNERSYAYHTDETSYVIYCPQEATFPVNPGEIQDGEPWMPVD